MKKVFYTFIVMCGAAYAQNLDATDLRAAFCLEPMRFAVRAFSQYGDSASMKTAYDRAVHNLNKTQGYLTARTPGFSHDKMLAIGMALKEGQTAVQKMDQIGQACGFQVRPGETAEQATQRIGQCVQNAGADMLGLEKCANASFLPY